VGWGLGRFNRKIQASRSPSANRWSRNKIKKTGGHRSPIKLDNLSQVWGVAGWGIRIRSWRRQGGLETTEEENSARRTRFFKVNNSRKRLNTVGEAKEHKEDRGNPSSSEGGGHCR